MGTREGKGAQWGMILLESPFRLSLMDIGGFWEGPEGDVRCFSGAGWWLGPRQWIWPRGGRGRIGGACCLVGPSEGRGVLSSPLSTAACGRMEACGRRRQRGLLDTSASKLVIARTGRDDAVGPFDIRNDTKLDTRLSSTPGSHLFYN